MTMKRTTIFICAALAFGIAAASDPVWVKVAAVGSTAEAKAAADFVCAGTNDQETIQKAIDLCAKDGRNLYLYNGLYMIDAFREWGDGGPMAGVRIPNMRRHFVVQGQGFFQAGRDAYLAGRMPTRRYADPSSPLAGMI